MRCASIASVMAVCLCAAMGAAQSLSPQEQREGFRPLFNGRDLRGWKVYAGANWRVQNGELVGPIDSAGWIGTVEEYDNFILRGEYWVDAGNTSEGNSGVFFRAQRTPTPWHDGYEMQISLQDERNPTGSIYGRVPTNLARMREISAERQWNQFEIRACGTHIQIRINGELVQDCDLHGFEKGVIGFQQHHPGALVKFRNLRIKRLSARECAAEGWQPLFNGKDLSGWFNTGIARWSVKDGAIVGEAGMGHLFTERTFRDFELRAMVRIRPFKPDSPIKPNNGIYFRAQPNPENRNNWPMGYEAQVFNHIERGNYITGSLYGRVMANRLLTRDGEWFALRIRAKDNHIQIFVNGQKVVDTRNSEFREGHIAIQCHDPFTVIETRDIYWRPL
ncbi:MAG: DUF1080 domain-containing protein [Armatimonadota bacterium]|nr:DUF1080 domain-containing protein [Armatimonadota bacterium]